MLSLIFLKLLWKVHERKLFFQIGTPYLFSMTNGLFCQGVRPNGSGQLQPGEAQGGRGELQEGAGDGTGQRELQVKPSDSRG